MQYIFGALKKTDVGITDIHNITQISRTTLHAWKNGGAVTDLLRLGVMLRVAKNLNNAFEAGDLPLPRPLKKEDRKARLQKIIVESGTKK